MTLQVAYQGEPGAFSEVAARRLLGTDIIGRAFRTFDEMFEAVSSSECDCCVAPIENSLAGAVHRNYDLLAGHELTIVGETNLRIAHSLIAPPDVELDQIRRVYSHPVALAQCGRFLRAHPQIEPSPSHDTAGSVRLIMENARGDEAAIASSAAASIYGARVLAGGIEDHPKNFTRYLLLALRARADAIRPRESQGRRKTSIYFQVADRPGALFRALGVFAMRDINLTRLESRPVEGRPWEYSFYLDFVGDARDDGVTRALANLAEICETVRVFGSYASKW